jgi:hypothetical protein
LWANFCCLVSLSASMTMVSVVSPSWQNMSTAAEKGFRSSRAWDYSQLCDGRSDWLDERTCVLFLVNTRLDRCSSHAVRARVKGIAPTWQCFHNMSWKMSNHIENAVCVFMGEPGRYPCWSSQTVSCVHGENTTYRLYWPFYNRECKELFVR